MQLESPVPLTNDGSEVISRVVNIEEDERRSADHDFEDFYEVNRCIEWINELGSKKVTQTGIKKHFRTECVDLFFFFF